MGFRVLDADATPGVAAWLALWRAWPEREIMAHPEYARLFARSGYRTVCAVGEDSGGTILFPLVLRPLAAEPWASPDETRWDAITPYGYGGPFSWGTGPRDTGGFWRGYLDWCLDSRIVSTFARLSLFADALDTMPGRVEVKGPNVVRSLRPGLDAIWQEYDRTVRQNVRTAERAGLTVEIDRTGARLDAFHAIYTHTMKRRGAGEFYWFPRSFFEAIVEKLPGQFAFVHALKDREVVSSELLLCSQTRVYSFLGGTRADAFKLRPNDLLRHCAVAWSVSEGKDALVLGGGYAPDDGILRHKRHLAPSGDVPFRVACLTHDEPAYFVLARERAVHEASRGVEWKPQPSFFPAYRA
jgi:hypothetical protein